MGDGIQFLDIILFAAIAAFLVLRLRSVLGRRSGNDQGPKYNPFRKRGAEDAGEDKVIALPDRGAKAESQEAGKTTEGAEGSPLEQGLTQIQLADRSFEPESFVDGAKGAFSEAEIIEAELQGKTAFVTLKFVSEQINVTRDAEGEVVDGDPSGVASVTDIWTFARNTRSRDPNWTLVATGTSN